MATLHFTTTHPSLTLTKPTNHHPALPPNLLAWPASRRRWPSLTTVHSHKVVIEHEGRTTELEVEPDETILSKALDSGLFVPHDCKLGVCMTCPAKLLNGTVDQSEGMLSDDVVERGCCGARVRSAVRVVPAIRLSD
ncbi:hypothetical protein TEA_004702 [Camellia sinensis var. sinensis]|uniref:2Fe-2S ferredoxin-type domain-containing protein n=1 Tax=Camellia sinensis var. sinensis TaxID=542762 RepID=A0A4S4EQ68_CAMSN|nr:hypothetical protein TEA_004702 [Camellia sinensis var. sinensis]